MKIDFHDSPGILTLLQDKVDFAWLALPGAEKPVMTDQIHFYTTQQEAENKARESADLIVIPRDVFQNNLYLTLADIPLKAKLDTSSQIIHLDNALLFDDMQLWQVSSEKAAALATELKQWGMAHDLTRYLQIFTFDRDDYFILETVTDIDNRPPRYTLRIDAHGDGNYHINNFFYEEKKDIKIVNVNAGDVNSLDLDEKMSHINWDAVTQNNFRGTSLNRDQLFNRVQAIQDQLKVLSTNITGQFAAEQLAAKHWLDTPVEQWLPYSEKLRRQFVLSHEFSRQDNFLFTMQEAYNLMHGRYVCRSIEENGSTIQPWYCWQPEIFGKDAAVFRIPGSELMDVKKIINKAISGNIHFSLPIENIIEQFKKGQKVAAELHTDRMVQPLNVSLDALSERLKAELLPGRQMINREMSEELKKGRSI